MQGNVNQHPTIAYRLFPTKEEVRVQICQAQHSLENMVTQSWGIHHMDQGQQPFSIKGRIVKNLARGSCGNKGTIPSLPLAIFYSVVVAQKPPWTRDKQMEVAVS